MNIAALNVYNNPMITKSLDKPGIADSPIKTIGKTEISENESAKAAAGISEASSNLITGAERDFFIKMFPENSEQIKRHVVFNRNGRLQTPNIDKGSIIDGRV